MHKLLTAVALFAFAGTLLAQSPFTGTWKLDSAQSKYTTGDPPKDVTVVIEEQGANYTVTATGTSADGSPLVVKYATPVKGGMGKMESGPYDSISAKYISASERVNTYKKGGKVVATRHYVVSKDGKTMMSSAKGIGPAGKPIDGKDVFVKQ